MNPYVSSLAMKAQPYLKIESNEFILYLRFVMSAPRPPRAAPAATAPARPRAPAAMAC